MVAGRVGGGVKCFLLPKGGVTGNIWEALSYGGPYIPLCSQSVPLVLSLYRGSLPVLFRWLLFSVCCLYLTCALAVWDQCVVPPECEFSLILLVLGFLLYKCSFLSSSLFPESSTFCLPAQPVYKSKLCWFWCKFFLHSFINSSL